MKIASRIISVVYVTILSLAPLQAMEAPAVEPMYELVSAFKPEGLYDAIVFVKRVSDEYLVVINRKGRGKLLDIKNNYKCINDLVFDTGFLENVFMYKDKNGQQLFIGVGRDLYVCNPALFDKKCCVTFDHKFSLVLAEKQSEKVLVVVNKKDKSTYPLELWWEPLALKHCPQYKSLFPVRLHESLQDFCPIDEGVLVDSFTYTRLKSNALPGYLLSKIFDIQSLTKEAKKLVDAEIYGYHLLNKKLYVGHGNGVVTVWEPKSNNQEPYEVLIVSEPKNNNQENFNGVVTVWEPKNNNQEPCLAQIQAMEAPATELKHASYKLVHIIQPKYANDMITHVKKISDNQLVFFDRMGHGELIDLTNNYASIKELSAPDECLMQNIFTYQDKDNQQLLIGFDRHLYVWNLTINDLYCCRRVRFKHKFTVVLAKKKSFTRKESEKILSLVNLDDCLFIPMDISWAAIKKSYDPYYSDLFSMKAIDRFFLKAIDEGLVVNSLSYSKNPLPKEIIELLVEEKKILTMDIFENPFGLADVRFMSFKNVFGYYEDIDGTLYIGHDGFITVLEKILL